MENNVIVKRYGYALFNIYRDESKIDIIKEIFDQFIDILNKYRQLYDLLNSPVISKKEKVNLLRDLMNIMKIDGDFLNFLSLLIINNRFKYIFDIYKFIIDLYNEENNKVVATLYVTDEPEVSILEQLKHELEKLIQYSIIFDIKVKKDILGGFVVIIKDKVIDVSIRKTLNELVLNIKGEI